MVGGDLAASFGHPDVGPDAVRVGGEAVAEVREVVQLRARRQVLADHEPGAVILHDLAVPLRWVGGGQVYADLQAILQILRAD